jgi:hypothetical protein
MAGERSIIIGFETPKKADVQGDLQKASRKESGWARKKCTCTLCAIFTNAERIRHPSGLSRPIDWSETSFAKVEGLIIKDVR